MAWIWRVAALACFGSTVWVWLTQGFAAAAYLFQLGLLAAVLVRLEQIGSTARRFLRWNYGYPPDDPSARGWSVQELERRAQHG